MARRARDDGRARRRQGNGSGEKRPAVAARHGQKVAGRRKNGGGAAKETAGVRGSRAVAAAGAGRTGKQRESRVRTVLY